VGVVRAPDGREWNVVRQWRAPPGDDAVAVVRARGTVAAAAALLVLIVLVVVVSLAVPELLLPGELVLLLLGVLAHVVFIRPWTVVARGGDEKHHWRVRGLRASSRAASGATDRIRSGLPLAGWSPGAPTH
jgi:hypothetical protein